MRVGSCRRSPVVGCARATVRSNRAVSASGEARNPRTRGIGRTSEPGGRRRSIGSPDAPRTLGLRTVARSEQHDQLLGGPMSDHPNVETVNRDDQGDLRPGPRHPGQDLHRRPRVPPPWPAPDGGRPPGPRRFPRCRRLALRGRPTARSSSTSSSASGPTGGPPSGSTPRSAPQDGETLESHNAFVYRFEGDRIAEMWMFLGVHPRAGRGVLRADRRSGCGQDWTAWCSHRGSSGGVRRPPVG